MKILVIDGDPILARALRDAGHTVDNIVPGGGVIDLPALVRHVGVEPDLLVQQERLGPRSYLVGLAEIGCPSVFWAVDSHLNLYWQRFYALLFDAVLTPHVSLFKALPKALRPPCLRRFALFGSERAFTPHRERRHALSMWARVDKHRPIRAWLIELLRAEGLYHTQDIDFEAMMRLYGDSRVVPNECIANEVTLRLMEGASAGCLVLSPDVGEDQNALLEPGTEFLIYHDGLELLDQVRWAAARPGRAEVIGLAARRRILADHLPASRAAELLVLAANIEQGRLTGREAQLALWLSLAWQLRAGRIPIEPAPHAEQGFALLAGLPGHPAEKADQHPVAELLADEALAQIFHLLAKDKGNTQGAARVLGFYRKLITDRRDAALTSPSKTSPSREPALSLQAVSACSALALRENILPMARALSALRPGTNALPGKSATEICLRWSADIQTAGELFHSGFPFKPENGMLPEDAFGWLVFALHLTPEDRPALYGHFEKLLRSMPALLHMYVGILAEHSLAAPEDWRVQLDYGMASIKACRVSLGLAEAREAGEKARAQGEERAFKARSRMS
ncbi:MAG: glycosyltransferase [Desulfovibrio sp.]|jgi:hypothetical protein|nr:glycosyltransferase [Desulfovibrio sp.]